MMKKDEVAQPAGDDDFVTKTNKSRKKSSKNLLDESKEGTGTTSGSSSATPGSSSSSAAGSDGISLRPRTMFTVKGRGRTESEGSPAYRPQWSKDGDGFVSNTPSSKEAGGESDGRGSSDPSRRKGKVLRYTKEELLALHFVTKEAPPFPPDAVVASEYALPPVSTLPFDYEEVYKQWSLNRNRGRGRGRTTTTGNAPPGHGTNAPSERSGRSDGKWEENKWEKPQRGDDREQTGERWERGAAVDRDGGRDDIWDDVGGGSGDGGELDLSSMAAAAEEFRREMDKMRDQVRQIEMESANVTDMDAFDQKLESAASAGQFEDSDEEVQWDTPVESVASLREGTSLFFQTSFDQAQSPEAKPLVLEEPSFNLSSLSDNTFGSLGSLSLDVVEDEWFYLDPQGLQQGPFKTAEMREWFEAGYFKPHLPIRFGREGTFTPLANQFAQGELPFAAPPRPSPKIGLANELRINEQQRLIEQQRQQQQQMLQLQQQQEQQRMLQFNQEEKIRMEMQRLEIARQHQNHLFQQQQQQSIHHQQQQQILLQQQQMHLQQQQQQQQMLMQQQQQQSSWQRSQRQGIMSALGIFGGNEGGLSGDAPVQFQSDFRNTPFDARDAAGQGGHFGQQPSNNLAQDPWGIPSGHSQREIGGIQTGGSGLFGSLQQEPAPQMQPQDVHHDPWGKPVAVPEPAAPASPPKDIEEVRAPHAERHEASHSVALPPAPEKVPEGKPSKKEKVASPVKEKPAPAPAQKQVRGGESQKRDAPWSNTQASASTSKSLKDIQNDEQREMRKAMEQQGESMDLVSMGTQLKMMLGVNSAEGTSGAASAQPTQPTPVPAAAPAPSPWGAATIAAQPAKAGKSMREILAEEERLAAERAKRNESAPASSHWVNVVAGNTAAPPAPKATRIPVPTSVLKSTTRSRTSVSGEITGIQTRPTTTPTKSESDASFWNFGAAQAAKASGSPQATMSNFGSSATPSDFMGWCAKQIKAINGSDDLTLVEYCATLEDPGEIREYLAAYLGSTPRVSAFATEFIQRKKSNPGGAKRTTAVDDADDAGAKKQGKRRTKGQKVDPSLLNYSVGS